jgi:tripartite-type tricarboxylate transporter receptor subunit TctC
MDSLFVINPYLYTKNIDPNKEFLPISTLASNEFVLAMNPKIPANNLKEFVAYVKKTSPAPAYASGGNGSQHHLTMEMLKAKAGMDLLHIPYKGGVEATTATMGGDSIAMFSGTSNAGLIKSGKLKAIAVSGSKRSKEMPDVPTIAEAYPGFDNTIWIGLFAVKGTPDAIVQKLRSEVSKALKDPAYMEALNKAGGIESFSTTPEEFLALIKKDQNKYKNIIQSLHLQLD